MALALLALAGLIAWDMQHLTGMSSYSRVGPTVFPLMLAAGLVLVSLGVGWEAIQGLFLPREPLEWAPVIWIVSGLLAQILLLRSAGFSIATGVVFAFVAKGMGRGPLWITIPVGVAFALFIYVVFARGLQRAPRPRPASRVSSRCNPPISCLRPSGSSWAQRWAFCRGSGRR